MDIFPGRTTSLGECVKLLLVIIYEQHQDFNMVKLIRILHGGDLRGRRSTERKIEKDFSKSGCPPTSIVTSRLLFTPFHHGLLGQGHVKKVSQKC